MFYGESTMSFRKATRFLAVAVSVFVIAGCATTNSAKQVDRLDSVGEDPKILLMPPDIRYYLFTAAGVPEPHEEWTQAAQANFGKAVVDYAASIGSDLEVANPDDLSDDEMLYESLHGAVGQTLLDHHFGMFKLPAKQGAFDWSLGDGVQTIGEEYGADYALFVFYRDYQASGGRIAFSILAAAAGVGIPMGAEMGFASLVDLKTGDIVWFNVVNVGSGELRDESGAVTAVRNLFSDMPTSAEEAPAEE